MAARRISDTFQAIPFDDVSRYYNRSLDLGIIDAVRHPIDYADTLIRLGYEPFPPIEETHFFHKSLALPSLPKYVYYLYTIDGFSGCFRGIVPHVAEALINRHLTKYVAGLSPFSPKASGGEPRLIEEWTEGNMGYFIQTRFWNLLSNLVAIQVSYPLHVLSVRTMARFVSGVVTEDGYRPSVPESWVTELKAIRSVWDLYAGCEARIFREIGFAVVSGAAYILITKFVQIIRTDPSQADVIEHFAEYIGNSLGTMYTTAFQNASDIMIINQVSDIPLGNPPFNDPFKSCWDCYMHLREDRKWKRSSFLGDRGYTGPIDVINDHMIPRQTFFGPYYMPRDVTTSEDTSFFLRDFYKIAREFKVSNLKKTQKSTENAGGIQSLSSDLSPSFLTGRGSFTTLYYGNGIPFKMGL